MWIWPDTKNELGVRSFTIAQGCHVLKSIAIKCNPNPLKEILEVPFHFYSNIVTLSYLFLHLSQPIEMHITYSKISFSQVQIFVGCGTSVEI